MKSYFDNRTQHWFVYTSEIIETHWGPENRVTIRQENGPEDAIVVVQEAMCVEGCVREGIELLYPTA